MTRKLRESILLDLLLLSAILGVAGWFLITQLAFWSPDVGLRYLQVKQLIAQDWTTLSVPYWAQTIDPGWQYAPYYYAFEIVSDEVFLSISPFFPLLISWLTAPWGKVGLILLPVLSGIVTGIGAYKLAQVAGVRRARLVLWATIFTTPVLFYSLLLWDHILGVAFTTWATYWTAKGIVKGKKWSMFWGGIVGGLATGQRPEIYAFALALGITTLILSEERKTLYKLKTTFTLGVGGLVGVAPIWWLQYRWVGHPLGFPTADQLLNYGDFERTVVGIESSSRTWAINKGYLLFYVRGSNLTTFLALLFALAGILLLVLCLRQPLPRRRLLLAVGTGLTSIGYGAWMWVGTSVSLPGLITTFPLLGFTLAVPEQETLPDRRTRTAGRFSLWVGGVFVLLMVLFWPSFGGFQWGARYLLPAYPPLLVAAFYNYEARSGKWTGSTREMLHLSFLSLLVMAFLLQLLGLRGLWVRQAQADAIRDSVAALPADVILTDDCHLPALLSSLEEKRFLCVYDKADLTRIIPWLYEKDIVRFALVSEGEIEVPASIEQLPVRQESPLLYSIGAP